MGCGSERASEELRERLSAGMCEGGSACRREWVRWGKGELVRERGFGCGRKSAMKWGSGCANKRRKEETRCGNTRINGREWTKEGRRG